VTHRHTVHVSLENTTATFPAHVTKAYKWSRGTTPLILGLGTRES